MVLTARTGGTTVALKSVQQEMRGVMAAAAELVVEKPQPQYYVERERCCWNAVTEVWSKMSCYAV